MHERVDRDVGRGEPGRHALVRGITEEIDGRANRTRELSELVTVGAIAQDLHAQAAHLRLRELCSLNEGREVVACAERARIGHPELARRLHDRVRVLAHALVKRGEVVPHVHRHTLVRLLAIGGGARGVLVGGSHRAREQLVDAMRVARERAEGDVAHDRHVHNHAHGLGPQIVHVGDEGNAVLVRRLRTHAGDVIGRNLGVDKVERASISGEAFREHAAQILRSLTMAHDAREVEVLLVAGLGDEDDAVREVAIARLLDVALGLLPMLERRGEQRYVEALAHEQLRQEAKARVAARFVAELHAHGDDGDALLAGRRVVCVR